jgi:hypothetical protein
MGKAKQILRKLVTSAKRTREAATAGVEDSAAIPIVSGRRRLFDAPPSTSSTPVDEG